MFSLSGLLLCLVGANGELRFPHFMQCDDRWGEDMMGSPGPGTNHSICEQGCAMTSLSMALVGHGYQLPGGSEITPKSLNVWLKANQGYHCDAGNCVNLVLDSPDRLAAGKVRLVGEWGGSCCGGDDGKPTLESMQENLALGDEDFLVYLAHVRNSSHFVLLTAWNASAQMFDVLDPYYNATQYTYEDMSDVIIYSVLPAERATVPKRYPLFQQFDYRWASDIMVTKTVSAVGCLMSSTSMALNGHSVQISKGMPSNPGSLNSWLRTHKGYDDSNDLYEERVPDIDPEHVGWVDEGMHRENDLSFAEVSALLEAGQPVIANVMHGHHFVLVVGWDSQNTSKLFVNDPGFYRISYDNSEVVGWRLYNMTDVTSVSASIAELLV